MNAAYRSRFAGLSRRPAWLVILALFAAIAASVAPYLAPAPPLRSAIAQPAAGDRAPRDEDLALYTAITSRIAGGEAYYLVAADELRRGNYPLRPFITFRLPTLAVGSALIGPAATQVALWLLMLATLLAWYRRLDGAFADAGRRLIGVMLLASGMTVAMRAEYAVVHEVWAGLLLALAVGLHRPLRWWPSVVVALAAVLIRELALPFLLLMGAFALAGRAWREAAGWAFAVALFGVALLLHAGAVAAVTGAGDAASPGWMAIGGWQAFTRAMAETSALRVFPAPLSAAFVVVALFGWLGWPGRTGLFVTLMFAGYAIIFMVLGRAENFYWGLIVSPLLLLGLVHLPIAVADLRAAIARNWT